MILGVGLDIIEVQRIMKAIRNIRFLERVYTPEERKLLDCRKMNPWSAAIAWKGIGSI